VSPIICYFDTMRDERGILVLACCKKLDVSREVF